MVIIKICGIRTAGAAQAAQHAGADWIGFIFAPASRRYIPPEKAAEMARKISGVKKVGVFVNEAPDHINAICTECRLDYVQLHGAEPADVCRRIARPVIKAFGFGPELSVRQVNADPAEFVLVDTLQNGAFGGIGKAFDWQAARGILKSIRRPVVIAGGLRIENVKQAVHLFAPYGIDVSSGVEEEGRQSPEKITAFVKAAREAQSGG